MRRGHGFFDSLLHHVDAMRAQHADGLPLAKVRVGEFLTLFVYILRNALLSKVRHIDAPRAAGRTGLEHVGDRIGKALLLVNPKLALAVLVSAVLVVFQRNTLVPPPLLVANPT
jgi:hypothetical protein